MPRTPPPEGRRFQAGNTAGGATQFQPGDRPRNAFQPGEPPPTRQRGRPFARGHDARREPGKALVGRKTEKFKAFCRSLLDSKDTQREVRAILSDGRHPAFVGMYRTLAEYGYGKAPASVDVTSGGESIAPGRLSPQEIAGEVARIVGQLAGADAGEDDA